MAGCLRWAGPRCWPPTRPVGRLRNWRSGRPTLQSKPLVEGLGGFREQRLVFSGEQYPVAVPGVGASGAGEGVDARGPGLLRPPPRPRRHDSHHKALRALANRLVGILHGCLEHRTLYDCRGGIEATSVGSVRFRSMIGSAGPGREAFQCVVVVVGAVLCSLRWCW